jgi:hypothetical protein
MRVAPQTARTGVSRPDLQSAAEAARALRQRRAGHDHEALLAMQDIRLPAGTANAGGALARPIQMGLCSFPGARRP